MYNDDSIKYARYTPVSEEEYAQKERAREEQKASSGRDKLYGLLCYRKWWERSEVDISVCGQFITGTPIFIEENTLRVVNRDYSYFIPLEKIDYIRTTDGLCPCLEFPKEKPIALENQAPPPKGRLWRKS